MSKTKTIVLFEPIKDHRGMIRKIVLREPRYSDFIWVSLADGGGGFSQETPFRSWGVDRAHRLAAPPKHGRPCNSIMTWRKP
jgi:hypothetical protein